MTYVVKIALSVLAILSVQIISYAGLSQSAQMDKEQLEENVREHLKESNVDLREHVDDLFLLADIYVNEGRDAEAVRLYEKGLSVNSWRLEYQLKLAYLLNKRGDKNQAIEKAKTVYQYAEEEYLITNAEKLLSDLGIKSEDERVIEGLNLAENVEIVLVPIGKVNRKLLREIRDGLEETMGVQYTISQKQLDLGKIDRSFVDKYLTTMVERIESELPQEEFQALLSELNLSTTVLEARDPKIKFIDAFFKKRGLSKEKIGAFYDLTKKLENEGQYDAERLLVELKTTFETTQKQSVKSYLGVTEGDIFAKDYNFLYGWGRRGHGVMSYHRFKAVFTKEPPNRPRLLNRSLKQGISSSFLGLGIRRCSTPTCSRAYPHNLTEHDQKSMEICSWCKERLDSVIDENK